MIKITTSLLSLSLLPLSRASRNTSLSGNRGLESLSIHSGAVSTQEEYS